MRAIKLFKILIVLCLIITNSLFSKEKNKNPISVHVLNLQTGLPDSNIEVELRELQNGKFVKISSNITDENGRITALYPKNTKLKKGVYKVIFLTGDFYKNKKQSTFFPEIPVIFEVKDINLHYHIPLLLSQYGYSTYRGN